MPRRRRAVIREVVPDPVYNSTLVEKFVNSMMWQGKKTVAQGIFYDAMDKLKDRTSDDPLKSFKKAVENAKPLLEVKTRRVGGANYQVPIEGRQNGASCEFFQKSLETPKAAAPSKDGARGRPQLPGAARTPKNPANFARH